MVRSIAAPARAARGASWYVTAPPPHDRIAGYVSVQYVLETFSNAEGPGAPVSRLALSNMRDER